MAQSKDEHIRLIMEKAKNDQQASLRPRSASLSTRTKRGADRTNRGEVETSVDSNIESKPLSKGAKRGGGVSYRSPGVASFRRDTDEQQNTTTKSSTAHYSRVPKNRAPQVQIPRASANMAKIESQVEEEMGERVAQNGRQVVEAEQPERKIMPKKENSNPKGKRILKSEKRSTTSPAARSQARKASIAKGSNPTSEPKRHVKTDTELHIWIALVIFFVSILLLLAFLSYLIYWREDADIATFSASGSTDELDALNWGGDYGAVISHLIIGRWLGVFGLILPFIIFLAGLIVIRAKRFNFFHGVWASLAIMMVGSLVLGHFAGYNPQFFGSGLGGESGIYITSKISKFIGKQGTSLLMIFLIIAVLYFAFGRVIKIAYAKYSAIMQARAAKRRVEQEYREEQELARLEAMRRRSLEMAAQRAEMQEESSQLELDLKERTKEESKVVVDESVEKGDNGVVADQAIVPDPIPSVEDHSNQQILVDHAPNLVPLEGGQYGYFMGYDEAEAPYYYYFDRSGLEQDVDTKPVVDEKIATEVVGEPSQTNSVIEKVSESLDNSIFEVVTPEAAPAAEQSVALVEDEVVDSVTQEKEKIEDTTTPSKPVELEANVVSEVEPKSCEENIEFVVVDTHDVVAQEGSAAAVSGGVAAAVVATGVATSGVETPANQATVETKEGLDLEVEQKAQEQTVSTSVIDSMQPYDPTAELPKYIKPTVDLLKEYTSKVTVSPEELNENKDRIVHTLSTFGIKIDSIKATIGPTVTLYEIVPAPGVRISKIKNLEDDIALTLSALGIRIIAPIPGKGTIGIEVPNKEKEVVSMHSVVRSAKFQNFKAELPIALGKTIQNETFVFDLAKMPHLLVAGATGQGKSVGLNAIITSLLYKKHPSELKLVLVDPKKVELTLYSHLEKHFLAKMEGEDEAIITDTQKVVYTLNSICVEMDSRYELLKAAQVRNIVEYNDKFKQRRLNPEKGHRFLPYFVVVVDEFADLIMTAGREIETPIARIAQLARAVGIHLIIATQRPTTNIITGVIKANFPARIAFRVTSMVDSRTILDTPGANQLIGKGDMLVSTGSEVTRVQCAFVDTPEVADIVGYIADQRGYVAAYELPEFVPESDQPVSVSKMIDPGKRDVLFEEVARFVVSTQQGSASIIQRKFSIGFARAGRLVDQLEAAGIVGRQEGSKARQVLIQDPISLEMILDTPQ